MVASMNEHGRLAVVLPNGVFFRGGTELAARKDLLDADLVEAVVQLAPDMFYGAGIPACVLVLNRRKASSRKGQVLFVNASDLYVRRDTKNALSEQNIEQIVSAVASADAQSDIARFVSADEIANRNYNLTVRIWVGSLGDQAPLLDFDTAAAAYRAAREHRDAAESEFEEVMAALSDALAEVSA
jgi:type I restriction enzyme M protein